MQSQPKISQLRNMKTEKFQLLLELGEKYQKVQGTEISKNFQTQKLGYKR
jgi:hypothetical protein